MRERGDEAQCPLGSRTEVRLRGDSIDVQDFTYIIWQGEDMRLLSHGRTLYTHIHMHTHIVHTHMHTHIVHTHTLTWTYTLYTQIHMHTHIVHAHTHAHTHCTHTHTHVHTQTTESEMQPGHAPCWPAQQPHTSAKKPTVPWIVSVLLPTFLSGLWIVSLDCYTLLT